MAILDARRRAVRLLRPAVQLRLPLYLFGISLVFVAAMAVVAYAGLMQPFSFVVAELPPSMVASLALVLSDFGTVASAATLAYVLVVLLVLVVYMERLVGPVVAFHRHVEALKNGDYQSRVRLRERDSFADLAHDLNELAGLLERDEKRRR